MVAGILIEDGMNDLIFRQVRILDGTGRPERVGDVSVSEGRVNEVGTVRRGWRLMGARSSPKAPCCALD